MISLLKAVHILGLIFWCGSLLVLPGLFSQRDAAGNDGRQLELQRHVRRVFIHVASPAAFIAVAAGTALLFMREVFTTWMMFKLLAVGLLVIIHIRAGFLILNLFEPRGRYSKWRSSSITVATVAVIGCILLLVLAKPPIELDGLPDWMRRPGGLQSFVETAKP